MGISNVTELLVMREQEARMKDDKDWFVLFSTWKTKPQNPNVFKRT